MSNRAVTEPDYKALFEQAPGLYMILDFPKTSWQKQPVRGNRNESGHLQKDSGAARRAH